MDTELALAVFKLFRAICGVAFDYIFAAALLNDLMKWNLPTLFEIRWK